MEIPEFDNFIELRSPVSEEKIKFYLDKKNNDHRNNFIAHAVRGLVEEFRDFTNIFEKFFGEDYGITKIAESCRSSDENNRITKTPDDFRRFEAEFNELSDTLRKNNFFIFSRANSKLLNFIINFSYFRAIKSPRDLNKYKAFSNFVYGEIYFPAIDFLLKNYAGNSDINFLDLGCGVGQVVMQVAGTFECKNCVGIEISDIPYEYSKILQNEFISLMNFFGKKFSPFTIIKGDFTNIDFRSIILNSNLIFANNFMFGSDLNNKLSNIFKDLRSGCQIFSTETFTPKNFRISLRTANDFGAITRVKIINMNMPHMVSWTDKPVLIYNHTVDNSLLDDFMMNIDFSKNIENGQRRVSKRILRNGQWESDFDSGKNSNTSSQRESVSISGTENSFKSDIDSIAEDISQNCNVTKRIGRPPKKKNNNLVPQLSPFIVSKNDSYNSSKISNKINKEIYNNISELSENSITSKNSSIDSKVSKNKSKNNSQENSKITTDVSKIVSTVTSIIASNKNSPDNSKVLSKMESKSASKVSSKKNSPALYKENGRKNHISKIFQENNPKIASKNTSKKNSPIMTKQLTEKLAPLLSRITSKSPVASKISIENVPVIKSRRRSKTISPERSVISTNMLPLPKLKVIEKSVSHPSSRKNSRAVSPAIEKIPLNSESPYLYKFKSETEPQNASNVIPKTVSTIESINISKMSEIFPDISSKITPTLTLKDDTKIDSQIASVSSNPVFTEPLKSVLIPVSRDNSKLNSKTASPYKNIKLETVSMNTLTYTSTKLSPATSKTPSRSVSPSLKEFSKLASENIPQTDFKCPLKGHSTNESINISNHSRVETDLQKIEDSTLTSYIDQENINKNAKKKSMIIEPTPIESQVASPSPNKNICDQNNVNIKSEEMVKENIHQLNKELVNASIIIQLPEKLQSENTPKNQRQIIQLINTSTIIKTPEKSTGINLQNQESVERAKEEIQEKPQDSIIEHFIENNKIQIPEPYNDNKEQENLKSPSSIHKALPSFARTPEHKPISNIQIDCEEGSVNDLSSNSSFELYPRSRNKNHQKSGNNTSNKDNISQNIFPNFGSCNFPESNLNDTNSENYSNIGQKRSRPVVDTEVIFNKFDNIITNLDSLYTDVVHANINMAKEKGVSYTQMHKVAMLMYRSLRDGMEGFQELMMRNLKKDSSD